MNTPRTKTAARVQRLWLLTPLLAIVAGRGNAGAAEDKWTGSAEVAYVSDYLWRGQRLASDSIQPQITEFYSDKFAVGLWGSYGLKDTSTGKYSETDLVARYSFSEKYCTFTVGGTLYRIEDLEDPETLSPFKYYFESLASITLKVKFSPTLTFWREFGRLKTNYIEFSFTPSLDINKQCQAGLRPVVGAFENSKHYYGTDIWLSYEFGNDFYGRATVTLMRNNYPLEKHERVTFGVATGKRW
jgi:hypothetical protein